jgi:hypothetical protein
LSAAAIVPKLAASIQSTIGLLGDIQGDLRGVRKILDGAELGVDSCGMLAQEEVEQLALDFSRLPGTTGKTNQQSLRQDSYYLRESVEQPRCLCTARGDMDEIALESWRFHVSLEEAKRRWESMK